jgi:hypothetical protein
MAQPCVCRSEVTLRTVSPWSTGVLFALQISILVWIGVSLTHCTAGASECGGGIPSRITFSGTVALPDDTIGSLVIGPCLDSDCWSTTGAADDGGSPGSDASSSAVTYTIVGAGDWTVTQIRSGLYALNGTIVWALSPTGSATSGTARVTITSHGVVLYDQTVLDVPCTQGMVSCGNFPSETCNVSLR